MYFQLVKYLEGSDFIYKSTENIPAILFAFLVIISSGLFLKYALKRRNYTKKFPSRKVKFFNVWGNALDFVSNRQVKGITTNVYMLQVLMGYHQLFKHEDFFFMSFAYSPYIFTFKAKLVEELISGGKNIQKNWAYKWLHPWLGTGLLTSHGSKWKSRRKLLTPAFHAEVLKSFVPIFNEKSQILVKKLQKETKKPWTDITDSITLCSVDIIFETVMGMSVGAQEDSESKYAQAVLRTSDIMMKRAFYPPYFLDWFFYRTRTGCQFQKDVKLLHNFTRSVISSKKQKLLNATPEEKKAYAKKRKGVIDVLLDELIKNPSFTEEDIREELDTISFESHDTTTVGMSWALYLIGLYKDVQKKVLQEIDCVFADDYERPVTLDDLKHFEYLDRVLKESQRLYPSVPLFIRNLDEDTMLCGIKVPKGVSFVILPYLLHRDEEVFPDPEKFDPDRFLPENTAKRPPFSYIPFSAGPRNCIGQKFALLKEKVVMINVLRHYTVESLDTRDKIPVSPELVLRPAVPIRIKIRPRRPSTSSSFTT